MLYSKDEKGYNLNAPGNTNSYPMINGTEQWGAEADQRNLSLDEAILNEEERFMQWVRIRNSETELEAPGLVEASRDKMKELLAKKPGRRTMDEFLSQFNRQKEKNGWSPLDIKQVEYFLRSHLVNAGNAQLPERYPSAIESARVVEGGRVGTEEVIPCKLVLAPLPPGGSAEGDRVAWDVLPVPVSAEIAEELDVEGSSRGSMIASLLPEEFLDKENGLALTVPPFDYDAVKPFDEASMDASVRHQYAILESVAERMKRAKRLLEPDTDLEKFDQAIDAYLEKVAKWYHLDEADETRETPIPASRVSSTQPPPAKKAEGAA